MGECYTEIEQCRTEYKWTIRQFDTHLDLWKNSKDIGINLKSPSFRTKMDDDDMIEWCFQLYFNGSSHEFKEWISLGITCMLKNKSGISGYFNIYIMHSEVGKKEVCKSDGMIMFEHKKLQLIDKFLEKKSTKSADDSPRINSLIIIFELMLISEPITTFGPPPIEIPEYELMEDYRELYESRACSDVTFIVDKKEIAAHKIILIARSRVFGAMFKHDMIENTRNCIEITDMTAQIFDELLRFIYTNEVLNIDTIAHDLLQAADKYELKLLKAMCEESLIHTINVENAADTLVLADDHNCEQLIVHTILFINEHGLDVLNTSGFKKMEESQPYLITEIYKALLINRSVGI